MKHSLFVLKIFVILQLHPCISSASLSSVELPLKLHWASYALYRCLHDVVVMYHFFVSYCIFALLLIKIKVQSLIIDQVCAMT